MTKIRDARRVKNNFEGGKLFRIIEKRIPPVQPFAAFSLRKYNTQKYAKRGFMHSREDELCSDQLLYERFIFEINSSENALRN